MNNQLIPVSTSLSDFHIKEGGGEVSVVYLNYLWNQTKYQMGLQIIKEESFEK